MEELEVVSVVYTEPTHTQILFTLKDKEGFEFPYYFCPNVDDEAPTYKYLQQLYDEGKVHPQFDVEQENSLLSHELREQRNQLLAETDKYMTIDYPISEDKKQELKEYRQALRDITIQKEFPRNVVWPEKPEL